MLPTQNGSLRIFRVFGVTVWVHWSWLIVALWIISYRQHAYDSPIWNAFEYLSLFGIVLLHEFGHALSCRQTGGTADTIVMWPLGGVAYVSPPPRAGAQLWSIAAGPLVNVVLIPVIALGADLLIRTGMAPDSGDFWRWIATLAFINKLLLVFNLLPIYPLDGGQIVRCLLWFMVGPRKSLLWSAGFGVIAAVLGGLWVLSAGNWWIAILALFLGSQSWRAFQAAREAGR